jgi:hypothetical protein
MLLSAEFCQHPGKRIDDALTGLVAGAGFHHDSMLQNDIDDFLLACQAYPSGPVILTTYSVQYSFYVRKK